MSGDTPITSEKHPGFRSRNSRPTTPLRPSSRSSFRDSARHAGDSDTPFPLNTFEAGFAELADGMADLEANLMHFQLMHESLSRFTESFAGFLYGLNMNAFCIDFPEGPVSESFGRDHGVLPANVDVPRPDTDVEATFMTTDTSFVEHPATAPKVNTTQSNAENRRSRLPAARGSSSRGRPSSRGRSSGLPRGRGRSRGRDID